MKAATSRLKTHVNMNLTIPQYTETVIVSGMRRDLVFTRVPSEPAEQHSEITSHYYGCFLYILQERKVLQTIMHMTGMHKFLQHRIAAAYSRILWL